MASTTITGEDFEDAIAAQIVELDRHVRELRNERDQLVSMFQLECSHRDIREIPQSRVYSSTDPSWRVCAICGLGEEGWSCGHQLLRTDSKPPQVTHKQGYRLLRGKVWANHLFVGGARLILREKLANRLPTGRGLRQKLGAP